MNERVTYRQQFTYCGKASCSRCREGKGHGPYWYAYISKNGQTVRKYVGRKLPADIEITTQENRGTFIAGIAEAYSPLFKLYQFGQFRLERRTGHEWQAVTNAAWQHRNVRMLLAYLVHSPGRRRGREQIIEELWPEQGKENATNRLNNTVHAIRQLLEPALARPALSRLLRLEAEILILADASVIWSDTDAFIDLSARTHATSDPVQAEALIEEAVALYGGDFLLEERVSEWALARREVLQRVWTGLLLELADHRMTQGALSRAIDALHPLLASDPTNEAAVRRLMLALAQLDRRNEALQVYQRLTSALDGIYGIVPLAETRKLYEAIRKGDIADWLPVQTRPDGGIAHATEKRALEEVKSISDVFPLLQRNALQAPRIGRSHQSPLVGRTEELEVLRKALEATETDGESFEGDMCHFWLLKGETGIGKTRLAEELSHEASRRRWSVAWSHSYEQESEIPYRLWTEILRKTIATIPEADYRKLMNESEIQADSAAYGRYDVQQLSILMPELQQALPAEVVTHSLRSSQEQLHMWETTCRFLVSISQKRPLLFVLDDLHWADGSSLELLSYLMRYLQSQANQQVLVVGTCRETELAQTHPLRTLISGLQREQALNTLDIQPLTQEQIGALVAPLPDPIVQHIQAQAAGNPFFAEELARYSYSELSTANTTKESQEITSPDASHLPETITAALDRRMSHLSNACQRLLGKAAVLGGSFELSLLRSMESRHSSNYDEDVLLDLLDEALQAGVLTEESSGMAILYHFWHPMIVSHLYAQLSVARRTQLHRKAAEALQELYQEREEEVAAAISQNLIKGGGSHQQITKYAEIAGNRAYSLSAYPEAQHHYEVAIAHREKARRREGKIQQSEPVVTAQQEEMHLAFLHERLGESLMVQGHYLEAYTHYEYVLKIRSRQTFETQAERQREAQIQALLWYEMGRAHGHSSNLAGVQECNERGQQVLRDAGVTSGVAWACLRLQYGNKCFDEGNYEEAQEAAQEGLRMFEDDGKQRRTAHSNGDNAYSTRILRTIEGDRSELGNIYETLGIIAGTTGQIPEALSYLNTALVIFEQQNNIRSMANVCNNIGTALMLKTANASANSYFRRSLSLAERVGDLPLISTIYINLGELAIIAGDPIEAEAWYRRSLKLAKKLNIRVDMCFAYCALTVILQDKGDLSGAIKAVQQALALGREISYAPMIGLALISLASLRITLVDEEQFVRKVDAKDHAIQRRLRRILGTLQRASRLNGLRAEDMARARLAQANVHWQLNDLSGAEEIAKETMEVVELRQHFQLLAQAQRLLGRILCTQGRSLEGEEYFRLALQTSRDYSMDLEFARAQTHFGEALLQQDRATTEQSQQGSAYLKEAYVIFAERNATLDLERVKRIMPRNFT